MGIVRMDALQRARDEWAETANSEPVLLPVSMRKPQDEPEEADAS